MEPAPKATEEEVRPRPPPWLVLIPAWLRGVIRPDNAREYDAFLSYPWRGDRPIAEAVQTVLQRFLCPWYRIRAKTVFRDLAFLPAGSNFEDELRKRIDRSNHLIVLASANAVESSGMEMEAQHWCSKERTGEVIVIVTDGEFKTWEEIRDRGLPPAIRERLYAAPVWASIASRRGEILASANRAKVRGELIEDLSQVFLRLYPNQDWGQLRGEERKQRRRALALMVSAIAALVVLAAVAWWQAAEAIRERKIAEAARAGEAAQRANAVTEARLAEQARAGEATQRANAVAQAQIAEQQAGEARKARDLAEERRKLATARGFGGWMGWEWTRGSSTLPLKCHVKRELKGTPHSDPFTTDPVLWLWVHPQVVEAGHPACDPAQPHRPPCEMKSCAQMGPDGKPNGHKCSCTAPRGAAAAVQRAPWTTQVRGPARTRNRIRT